jgi:hypothetical protein
VACTAGGACKPPGPCQTGAISCATGTATCQVTGNLPNGTSCGPQDLCENGVCIAL